MFRSSRAQGVQGFRVLRLMIQILDYLKDPKLWELWYIPDYGSCRIYIWGGEFKIESFWLGVCEVLRFRI